MTFCRHWLLENRLWQYLELWLHQESLAMCCWEALASWVNLYMWIHFKIITNVQLRWDSIYFGHRLTVLAPSSKSRTVARFPLLLFLGLWDFLIEQTWIHRLTMLNELLSHAISVHQCTGPFIPNRNVYLIWKMSGHMVYIVWISSILFNSFRKSFCLLLSLCCGQGRND